MIRAELIDGSFIRVAPNGLDLLLRHRQIRRFQRDYGWALVGRDPLRGDAHDSSYQGPERRRAA